jgi:hypothetical protein
VSEHPAAVNARRAVELEEMERLLRAPERTAFRRFWKAVMLSPDVETLEALLDGQGVPLDRLDPVYVTRFGMREAIRAKEAAS